MTAEVTASNFHIANLDSLRELGPDYQVVADVLSQVPKYEQFGSSDLVRRHFKQLYEEYRNSEHIHVRLEKFRPDRLEPEEYQKHPHLKGSLEGLVIELPNVNTDKNLADYADVLLVGNVHPNELVWTLTFRFFSRLLCENPDLMHRFGIRHITFLDANPDLTRLSGEEMYKKGPLTILEYISALYRGLDHPEWDLGFKFRRYLYRSRRLGTLVLERLLKEERPDVIQTMHNASFGGMFFYVWPESRVNKKFRQAMTLLRESVDPPLPIRYADRSSKEVGKGTGIYEWPTATDFYKGKGEKVLKAIVEDGKHPSIYGLSTGDNVAGYIKNNIPGLRSLVLTSEVPYYVCRGLYDNTPLEGQTLADIKQGFLPFVKRMKSQTEAILSALQFRRDKGQLSHDEEVLFDSTAYLNKMWAEINVGETYTAELLEKDRGVAATVANRARVFNEVILYGSMVIGQAARLAKWAGLKSSAAEARQILHEIAESAEEYLRPEFVPRRTQVIMQAGVLLLGLLARKERIMKMNSSIWSRIFFRMIDIRGAYL